MFSLVVLLLAVAAICTVTSGTDPIKAHITCDDVLAFYVDGASVVDSSAPNSKKWDVVTHLSIPADSEILAIKCVNTGGPAGILASFSDGTVTDDTWSCTDTVQTTDAWVGEGFDDSSWDTATAIHQNIGNEKWGHQPGISSAANWIWTTNWGEKATADSPVFCRKVLHPQCTHLVPDGYKMVHADACPGTCGEFHETQEYWGPPGTTGSLVKCWRSCYVHCPVDPIKVDLTCDNILTFYVDGVTIVDSNTHNYEIWNGVTHVSIAADSEVLAVKCVNTGGPAGFLASFSDGTVSDDTWRCTKTVQTTADWIDADFDDSSWKTATAIHQNTGNVPVWGPQPGISPAATWIWTPNWGDKATADSPVYCRKVLRPQCSDAVPAGYKLTNEEDCPGSCGELHEAQEHWEHPDTGIDIKCWRNCYVECPEGGD